MASIQVEQQQPAVANGVAHRDATATISEPENAGQNAIQAFRLVGPVEDNCAVPLTAVASMASVLDSQVSGFPRTRKRKYLEGLVLPTRKNLDRAAKHNRLGTEISESTDPPPPIIVPNAQPSDPFRMISPLPEEHPESVSTVAQASRLDLLRLQQEAVRQRKFQSWAEEADARVIITVKPNDKAAGNEEPKNVRLYMHSAVLTSTAFDWAPGMTCVSGITYVDPVLAPQGPPPPTVEIEPARWQGPKRVKPTKPPLNLPVFTQQFEQTRPPTADKKRPATAEKRPPSTAKPSPKPTPSVPAAALSTATTASAETIIIPPGPDEDPLSASVSYLQVLGRCIGRLPLDQYGLSAEMRRQQSRIAHALYARDGRMIEKPKPQGTRRSHRARQVPEAFVPPAAAPKPSPTTLLKPLARKSAEDTEVDPGALTDVRVGPGYQCALPMQRRLPAKPSSAESRYLGELVIKPGDMLKSRKRKSKGNVIEKAQTEEARADIIATQWKALADLLGPERSQQFGLGSMGATNKDVLSEEEQEALYKGMQEHGRDFVAISKEFITTKTPEQLACYYYDIWKLRLVPAAVRWYDDKEKERLELLAEAEEEERRREAETAKRAERQEAAYKRRMAREAVAWVRNAGKTYPLEVSWNKTIVRERAGRIIDVFHKLQIGEEITVPPPPPPAAAETDDGNEEAANNTTTTAAK